MKFLLKEFVGDLKGGGKEGTLRQALRVLLVLNDVP